MTDQDIIKALECCTPNDVCCCEDCAYYPEKYNTAGCINELMTNVLDLINRQQAEIESLKIANEPLTTFNVEAQAEIKKLERVISHLEGVWESTPDKISRSNQRVCGKVERRSQKKLVLQPLRS